VNAPDATGPVREPSSFLRHLQPLTLRLERDGDIVQYGSLVLDYTVGAELVIGVPMVGTKEVELPTGTQLQAISTHADGLRISTVVVQRRRELPSPCLYVSWPKEVRRVQRREHVRVEVLLPARVALDVEGRAAPRPLSGQTLDLSAGGVRLALAEALPVEARVQVMLELPKGARVECPGRVVRAGENPRAAADRQHWVGIEFMEIREATRRELNRFIVDVQREQIRRGAL
jgi:c-di-GMP-binding flagellar brake protein YcgR